MESQIDRFIQERVYLKSVTPATFRWYRSSFKAFEGALDTLESVKNRITELRKTRADSGFRQRSSALHKSVLPLAREALDD
jgi:hypothetical protein